MPLFKRMLHAQGEAYNMMLLGKRIHGCIDTCKIAGQEGDPRNCEVGSCKSTLRSTRRLETLLGGLEWKRRAESARRYCATYDTAHDMKLDPPAGWEELQESSMAFCMDPFWCTRLFAAPKTMRGAASHR